jgi:hypothetical protein
LEPVLRSLAQVLLESQVPAQALRPESRWLALERRLLVRQEPGLLEFRQRARGQEWLPGRRVPHLLQLAGLEQERPLLADQVSLGLACWSS